MLSLAGHQGSANLNHTPRRMDKVENMNILNGYNEEQPELLSTAGGSVCLHAYFGSLFIVCIKVEHVLYLLIFKDTTF